MTTKLKIPKITFIICFIAVLFAVISIYSANRMRTTSQDMYEHPYMVTNTAREMRSRLLDMKRFVGIFMTTGFDKEDDARKLFEERYKLQNEAIDKIKECYLGSKEDVAALRESMDDLIAVQDEALKFVGKQHTAEEIQSFIDENIYPCYDAVSDCLDAIIAFSDSKIYSLTESSTYTAVISIGTALFMTIGIVFLTITSNIAEQKNIRNMKARELELQDALLAARKANNAKKDFLSRMSHEIRTPMNAIIGMTAIAGSHLEDRGRVEDCLSKIAFSSRHLLSLINDILDMSKIEAGKLTIGHEAFRLPQLTEAVISVAYPQAKGQGKIFKCSISDVTHEIFVGDFLRVNQILLNLLSNAIKFTPQGGTIRLEIKQVERKNGGVFLQFVVSDTGIGMSEEFLEHLFLPFEQADNQISQKYGGTGLGMAITHNLVDLLGGSIQVKSKPQEGTTFTVQLPFDLPAEAMEQRKWQLDTLKVLVVDDEEDVCIHATLLLKRMGILSHYLKSGQEAVKAVLEAHETGTDYDVCIIDWQMPDMDGVKVTRQIREKLGPDTLIIIISAYDWSEIEEEARLAGANAFIAKPLFQSTLYNVLVSAFGAAPSQPSCEEKSEVERDIFTGKRFLLAEDNALNQEIAVELLSMTGAVIDCATNGEEAVKRFEVSPAGYYDLILMDVQMPIMDGYAATRQIRAGSHPDAGKIPILAMTANTFTEDVDASFAAGMNGHIAKPIELKILYRTIRGLL